MKFNLLLGGVILSSMLGYLSYGQGMSVFLFQAEIEAIYQLFTNPKAAIHPFVLLPMLGQLLLILVLFQRKQNKWFVYFGILGMSVLLAFIAVIGLISFHPLMFLSTLPFFVISILTIREMRARQRS